MTICWIYGFIWNVHLFKLGGEEVELIDHVDDVDGVVYKMPDQGGFTDPNHLHC